MSQQIAKGKKVTKSQWGASRADGKRLVGTGSGRQMGLAEVEGGWQVIERTRYTPQDWKNGNGHGLGERDHVLVDSVRLGVISLRSGGQAVFTADPDVEIGTVEGLEHIKLAMTAVESGTLTISDFSPQQNPLVSFRLEEYRAEDAADAIAAANDDATVDEILGENDDSLGLFESDRSVGTLPPFAFTDASLVIDTEKGTATFAAAAGK